MILALYRAMWEPALWAVRLGAALERAAGGKLWPARWRLAERLGGGGRPDGKSDRPAIWLHAASLGECKGLWAFAQTLRASLSDREADIILTANTTAGLEFLEGRRAADAEPARWTTRLAPLDHPRVAAGFLRARNVRALILFEVELWPYWIFAASENKKRAGIPVFWISARVTDSARRRYAGRKPFTAALRRVLENIAWTQAQTDAEAEILRGLGCGQVETGGDLRGLHYLNEAAPPENPLPGSARRGIAFVSMHAQELPAIVPKIAAAGTESPLIIFPRKMGELPEFMKALAPLGFILYSENPAGPRVVVDSFGLVGVALKRCRLAVIGGSFVPRGGHNLWEPLLAGTRIATGPHHENQACLARKLADAGMLRVLQASETIPGPDPSDQYDAASTDEARERFIAREARALNHAADRACARILKAL